MKARLALLAALLAVGCSSSSGPPAAESEAAVAAPVAFNVAGDPTVEFNVPNMMCEDSCAAKVREILAEQKGVADVKVDFPTRKACIAVKDVEKFDAKAAIAALVDYGFDKSEVVESGGGPQSTGTAGAN